MLKSFLNGVKMSNIAAKPEKAEKCLCICVWKNTEKPMHIKKGQMHKYVLYRMRGYCVTGEDTRGQGKKWETGPNKEQRAKVHDTLGSKGEGWRKGDVGYRRK